MHISLGDIGLLATTLCKPVRPIATTEFLEGVYLQRIVLAQVPSVEYMVVKTPAVTFGYVHTHTEAR